MSNQLKLLLYIVFIIGIFYFIQNKFDLFDISLFDGVKIENLKNNKVKDTKESSSGKITISTDGGKLIAVNVEVARSLQERQLGLSFRKYLGDYEGMYFVFDSPTNGSFWMKDMLIPLDVIFIDEDNFVVDIEENAQPCVSSSCPSIFSNSNYKYVLEVKAGFCSLNGVKIGSGIVLN